MLLEASRKRLASRSVKFILFKIKVERIDEIGQLGRSEVGWTIRLLKRLCPEIKWSGRSNTQHLLIKRRATSLSSSCLWKVLTLPCLKKRRPIQVPLLKVEQRVKLWIKKYYHRAGWNKPETQPFITLKSISSSVSFPPPSGTACKGKCHPFVIF